MNQIPPRNDLKALQQLKSFIQGASKVDSSGWESLVFHEAESACLQDLQYLAVVHSRSDVEFRQIAGAHHGATEFGVARRKELAHAAAYAGNNILGIKQDFGDRSVEGVERAGPKGALRWERVVIRIKETAWAHSFRSALRDG